MTPLDERTADGSQLATEERLEEAGSSGGDAAISRRPPSAVRHHGSSTPKRSESKALNCVKAALI
jgi:hypothetical protein